MNLLVTGAWSSAREYIGQLEEVGSSTVYMQYEKEPLPCEYNWVEGVIGNGLFLSHPIERFENLKYIQLTSVGFDRVPMEYIKKRGIVIRNAKGVYSIPMAEFAIAGILQLYKRMRFFSENQKKHRWEKHRELFELYGKTVCIVGCGDVGTECAKRFAAFGCKVVGVNRTVHEDRNYQEIAELDRLDSLLSETDILVLAIALTKHTKHLINKERIKKLKPTAVIVNIARGAIIDMRALENMIDGIGGAVLDVFDEEPLNENSPLWKKENVIVTPHNSFVGENNQERLSKVVFQNLGEWNDERRY